MTLTYDKFYGYLAELNNSYVKMAALFKNKIEAVEAADIIRLEELISEEQVFLMITKGFDKNIAAYRRDLNLSGETLGATIEQLPEEQRERFTLLHGRLKETLDEAKRLNDDCKKLLETKLAGINKKLRERDKLSPPSSYDKKNGSGPHILSKSV